MTKSHLVACAQLTSKDDVDQNLQTCARLCREAAGRGAKLLVLPENFAFLGKHERAKLEIAEVIGHGPIVSALSVMAKKNGLWIIAGGMAEKIAGQDKVHNTLVAVDPNGEIAATYRKIHMFDVDIPGGATFKETNTCAAGTKLRVLKTPFGPVGLSICYDLRFPELYRRLVEKGARIMVVPAAFTQHTGKDHWHPLLRARAIENQVYVLAAGQLGRHNDKRVSYGHSMIIDPWGTVVAEAPDRECVIVADVDPEFQGRIRDQLPSLLHRRLVNPVENV